MSLWSGRSVFVTGATGLLGSWLTEELVARGAGVTALVRDWVPASRLVRRGTFERVNVVRGALEDLDLLERAINEYEVDSVFHLGAQTTVGTAGRSPVATFEANVRGTWNLLEACRRSGARIERVVVASSDKAYGDSPVPYTEDQPLRGTFPYDVSKSCTDLIATSYHRSYRLPVAITRCANLFGGGDLNFDRLVPGTIRSALRREPPIVRSDGSYVRDTLYVRDAVTALLELAERLPGDDVRGEAFNFGNGAPLSVLELVATILRLAGAADLEPRILGTAEREIRRQVIDSGKAERVLGWTPRHPLEPALVETIAWYADFLELPGPIARA